MLEWDHNLNTLYVNRPNGKVLMERKMNPLSCAHHKKYVHIPLLLHTCNIVSKPHCGQGDNDKVRRLQVSPVLHLLEN